MNASTDLQHDVEAELRWDPRVPSEQIGVTVNGEVIQLDGQVGSLFQKWAAESAALRVNNVKAVANEIKVEFGSSDGRSDADIAQAALSQLEWNYAVPDTVKVTVSNGWVTFEGTVVARYQSEEAERVLRSLKGVKGIVNEVTVSPKVNVSVVQKNIVHAFARSAVVDAKNIQVETSDGTVTLRGHVRSWGERQEAQRTAWAAPGVRHVENTLTVCYT
jgi:osmotically-inducible protein OsmY